MQGCYIIKIQGKLFQEDFLLFGLGKLTEPKPQNVRVHIKQSFENPSTSLGKAKLEGAGAFLAC